MDLVHIRLYQLHIGSIACCNAALGRPLHNLHVCIFFVLFYSIGAIAFFRFLVAILCGLINCSMTTPIPYTCDPIDANPTVPIPYKVF